jgi:hypothetical protein
MRTDYEPLFDALDAHIKANTTCFKNANMGRVPYWTNVNDFPFLGLRQTGVLYEYVGQGLLKTTVKGEIFIFDEATSDPEQAPRTELNAIVEEVLECFEPDCSTRDEFTIGMPNDVYHCRIEGEVTYAPGDQTVTGQTSKSIALLPVRILLNG